VKVIIVMNFLHNFIRVIDPLDVVIHERSECLQDTQQPETAEYGLLHPSGISWSESTWASKKRDEIAKKMWTDYQTLLVSLLLSQRQPDKVTLSI
jgi:hypothetical protein